MPKRDNASLTIQRGIEKWRADAFPLYSRVFARVAMSFRASTAGIIFSVFVALLVPVRSANGAEPAPAPGSVWSISIVDLKGKSLGTITLELTDESTHTCMSGEWKKTRLISSSFQSPEKALESKEYIPTYETEGQTLTIQLNPPNLCDAYLFLTGKFTERDGKGDYTTYGLGGGIPRGKFTAKRQ